MPKSNSISCFRFKKKKKSLQANQSTAHQIFYKKTVFCEAHLSANSHPHSGLQGHQEEPYTMSVNTLTSQLSWVLLLDWAVKAVLGSLHWTEQLRHSLWVLWNLAFLDPDNLARKEWTFFWNSYGTWSIPLILNVPFLTVLQWGQLKALNS